MPEPNTTAGNQDSQANEQTTQQQSEQQQPAQKFVGKYDSQEALEQGIREIARTVGKPLPEDGPLIGNGGRFKTVGEAEAAYKAYSRMQSRARQGQPDQDKNQDTPPVESTNLPGIPEEGEGASGEDLDTAAILESAGLDNNDIVRTWTNDGKLTDEQYSKLQSVLPGVSRKMIDSHLQAQQMAAAHVEHIHADIKVEAAKIAGGEQQLQNLLGGARRFVPADEIDGLNKMLDDPKHYKTAIRVIMDHHRRHIGADKSQTIINGDGGTTSSQPLQRGTQEYFKTVRLAGQGNEDAKRRLRQLANG